MIDQDALDKAALELQRSFGREGSVYGIKACEEIARLAIATYQRSARPEAAPTEPWKHGDPERRKDNWTLINAEEHKRVGRKFKNDKGREFIFFGIVDGYDDYYYGMGSWEKDSDAIHLLSCVGSIEMMGFTEVQGSKSLEDGERERDEARLARRAALEPQPREEGKS